VVSNHILNRASARPEDLTGDPVYDAADLVSAPTIYDRAHAAGLRTAAIDWPATRHAASLDFNLPFFKSQPIFEAHTAPAVWAELAQLGYPVERQGDWAELPRRFLKDAMVADLAIDVLRRHAPDLLLVHFLCADSHQHLYGPRSPEAYWAIAYIDDLVGRVLTALGPDGLDRTSVVVVSDHGFLPVTREVRPNVRLRRRGVLRVDADGTLAHAQARFVMNHGAGWVYALDGDPARLARDLRAELASLEGVAAVWTPDEYAALGLPTPDANPRAGDLLLEAAPGFMLSDEMRGDDELGSPRYRGTHGQRPVHADNHAVFLAAGRGIAREVRTGPITSRDVAPTLATLLELPPAPAEGRVLTEILG
jgi:Type I phosphodiesterase / nucleotide pyrophosphatase